MKTASMQRGIGLRILKGKEGIVLWRELRVKELPP